MPNYKYCDFFAENFEDPILKAIAKWRNHPSILAIASEYKNRGNLKEEVLTEGKVLNVSKTIQESYIPGKIIKANENLFAKQFAFS